MSQSYDDIIFLPHPVSKIRPPMPMEKRAAQFAPFAALAGYEDGIRETARLTDRRKELDEDAIYFIDLKLQMLAEMLSERPEVSVTYFQQDEKKKEGGAYICVTGTLKKIDDYEKAIILHSDRKIMVEDILEIECELLKDIV